MKKRSEPVVLEVCANEEGMKLLRFLERRLLAKVPKALLHKWIRTGQVRVNGGRSGAFSRLAAQDMVRLPPFAPIRTVVAATAAICVSPGEKENVYPAPAFLPSFCVGEYARPEEAAPWDAAEASPGRTSLGSPESGPCPNLGSDIRIIARTPHFLVLAKPAGLPCQPGSKHSDSVCARLTAAFSDAPFIPAPAHRIDRLTSGLVTVGMSHAAQRRLHALFASGGILKEYLAWVWGEWTPSGPCLLRDRLGKACGAGRETVTALPGGEILPLPKRAQSDAGEAAVHAAPVGGASSLGVALSVVVAVQKLFGDEASFLKRKEFSSRLHYSVCAGAKEAFCVRPCASLLLLRLLTGRTHQLRAQLASRGFSIIGDGRYAGPRFSHMLLHAFSLSLPVGGYSPDDPGVTCSAATENADDRLEASVSPSWPAPFIPDAVLLARARRRLAEGMDQSVVDSHVP